MKPTLSEVYNYRLKNRTEEELERAKKHDCDGICYCNQSMCSAVDTCEETRTKEFLATILAPLIIIIIPILLLIALVLIGGE